MTQYSFGSILYVGVREENFKGLKIPLSLLHEIDFS